MPARERSPNTRVSPDRISASVSISCSSIHKYVSASEIVDTTNLGVNGVVSLASCKAVPDPADLEKDVAIFKNCNNASCSGTLPKKNP